MTIQFRIKEMNSTTISLRGSRKTVPNHLGRTRVISAKLRQSDARWRASIQACYTLLRPVLQSRQPGLSRASKARTLEATRQHILELERALGMLLEMKNNVVRTLFDGTPPPRLTVEQYKTLFRSLYPQDAPVAEPGSRGACGCLRSVLPTPVPSGGPAGDATPLSAGQENTAGTPLSASCGSGTSGGTGDQPPTEPDLAELASLLHDAYDANDGQVMEGVPPSGPLAGEDVSMSAPMQLEEAAMIAVGPSGAEGDSERGLDMPILVRAEEEGDGDGGEAQTAGGDAETDGRDTELLPDIEENLSLELPSLELSAGWGDCDVETPSALRSAWQELERTAQSLSVPAELEQFTKIQRSDWDLDTASPAAAAPPVSHLSPFSPEMALPALCSTPDGGEAAGGPLMSVTPPPGAGRAKRAGSTAAAASRRAADRCRRTLALAGR